MIEVVSDTKQIFMGKAYYRCGAYFQRKGKRLHRIVWEFFNGKIPDGHHVHHKDGNKANNEIENLELMRAERHMSLHSQTPEARAHQKYAIEIARVYAAKWHKTPEAKVLHSKWAKEGAKKVKPIQRTCKNCGQEYMTKPGISAFCSPKCKAAYRRKLGVDNEQRVCEICGKEFEVNKYANTRCCSRACAGKRESRTKRTACGI